MRTEWLSPVGPSGLRATSSPPSSRDPPLVSSLSVTERSAYGIVSDLAEAGYIVKQREGRPIAIRFSTYRFRSAPTEIKLSVPERSDRPRTETLRIATQSMITSITSGPL